LFRITLMAACNAIFFYTAVERHRLMGAQIRGFRAIFQSFRFDLVEITPQGEQR
jgi:hypothetical protein